MQGRLQAVLLCLRYVDTVAIGAWFVPSWCAQKKQVKKKSEEGKQKQKEENKKKSRDRSRINHLPVGNYRLRRAERWEYIPTVSSEVIEI